MRNEPEKSHRLGGPFAGFSFLGAMSSRGVGCGARGRRLIPFAPPSHGETCGLAGPALDERACLSKSFLAFCMSVAAWVSLCWVASWLND